MYFVDLPNLSVPLAKRLVAVETNVQFQPSGHIQCQFYGLRIGSPEMAMIVHCYFSLMIS